MLRTEPDELDADRFERLLSRGQGAQARRRITATAAEHAPPGARAVAGPGAGGLHLRPLRPGGDRAPGGAATRRRRGARRGGPRPGQSGRPGRGARGPDQRQPPARAPARAADARPLSLRSPGGRPRGLPADLQGPRRAARPRPEPAASSACRQRSSARSRRSRSRSSAARRPSRRRSRPLRLPAEVRKTVTVLIARRREHSGPGPRGSKQRGRAIQRRRRADRGALRRNDHEQRRRAR